jgi:PAS domain S-box-containing protein
MTLDSVTGLTQALFEEAGDALFLFDPETEQLLAVNGGAERLTGLARAQLLLHPATYWFRFGSKGGRRRLRQAASRSGVFHSQDGFYLRTRTSEHWVPVNLTISRLHVQPRTLALITARDVREQREAYQRLEDMEAQLRRVLSSVSDCLWSAELDAATNWKYEYLSPVVERITGRPAEFFLPGLARWEHILYAEDRPRWQEAIARLRAGKPSQAEYRIVLPDGSCRWVRESVTLTPGETSHRADGVLTDITQWRQAAEKLHQLNTFLDSIVENVPIMLFVKDAEQLRFQLFNRAGEDLLGYRRTDLIGKNDYDFFPEAEADFFIAKDREVLAGKKLVDIPEEEIETSTGRKFLHTLKIPLLDEHGTARYLLGISEEITARKALEETRDRYAREMEAKNRALAESERRYRELTEAALDAIVVADAQGTLVLFNPAAERLFGYSAAEILGQPLARLLPPAQQEAWLRDLQSYHDTGTARLVGRVVEMQGRRRDGSDFPMELALIALARDGATQFLASIRDLTERNRMRSALVQTEKLAAIGRLSAIIVHEINNPLTYVANNLTVLERDSRGMLSLLDLYEKEREPFTRLAPDSFLQVQALTEEIDLPYIRDNIGRLLQRTRDGLDRVTRIIHSLRGHARTAAARQEVNLPELIDSSLEIIQGKLRKRGIQVERDFGPIQSVRGIASDLGQVLLNLLVNACQAIEATPGSNSGLIRVVLRPVGPELFVEVTDNGCGIEPDNLARLFDPFFTTKDAQEGSGLGLWVTHNIINDHGGRIEVESQPGRGSSFRLYLPLTG